MSDIVERLIASSCSENCLMGKAAKEIERLRKIEAAARQVLAPPWVGYEFDADMVELEKALGEE